LAAGAVLGFALLGQHLGVAAVAAIALILVASLGSTLSVRNIRPRLAS
jgi:threonine/homoserine efflux transporter RhtA